MYNLPAQHYGLVAAAGLFATTTPAAATIVDAVLIDDFIVQQSVSVTAAVTPPAYATALDVNSSSGITAIGGERELYVRKTAGGDDERVRSRVNPDGLNLWRMTIDDASGLVRIIYDGIDGTPSLDANGYPVVDFNGLGGIDLSAGLLDPFFELELTFSDIGGPFNLWVYENGGGGTKYASGTITLPGSVPANSSVVLSKEFDTFTLNGATTLYDVFTNAGAIVAEINATAVAQEGWDMRIDYLKTRGTERVPVPPTLALLGIGWAALRLRRRAA